MAKRLDHLLVVDVEATCWEGDPPAGQLNEIIEIGICLLEIPTLYRLDKRSILVRPERSTVSDFCTQLTTITPEMVQNGKSFQEACSILRKEFRSEERAWASYGDYDRTQFEKQCRHTGTVYPFGRTHLNVKSLLALAYGLPNEIGMSQALELMGLPLEGTHHRGHDDAWNIAAVAAELLHASRNGRKARFE